MRNELTIHGCHNVSEYKESVSDFVEYMAERRMHREYNGYIEYTVTCLSQMYKTASSDSTNVCSSCTHYKKLDNYECLVHRYLGVLI